MRDRLRELFPTLAENIRRGQQYSGIEGDDVVGLPGIHIECKRVEKLNIYNAMKQSCKDAESAEKGELPIVCHRKNRCDWLVTFRLDDMLDFAEKVSVLNQMEEFPY